MWLSMDLGVSKSTRASARTPLELIRRSIAEQYRSSTRNASHCTICWRENKIETVNSSPSV